DKRPFNLSRRHFAIEQLNGALIVRDCGSYHGTTLNGMILGGQDRPQTAPLMTGESELVAGKPDSPFRFCIIVG
ncbi:MAG: FHA domain-containing protein, partial [Alphaproteobacteria bacterium]